MSWVWTGACVDSNEWQNLDTYVRSMHTWFGGCQALASNTGKAAYVAEKRDFVAN